MGTGAKYYFPQLDSIRGLSFLAVYFFHAIHPQFGSNFLARMLDSFYNSLILSIDVFFILSSFLLTWLGISEYKAKGNFSFISYFMRRALRIWPLYFLLMIFSFVLVPYVAAYFKVPITLPPAHYYIFFISNFYLEPHVYFLRFLWTLAVEEQFYLLWGLCLWMLPKQIRITAYVLVGISILFKVYTIINNVDYYFHTLTYLFDFAVGILAAFAIHHKFPFTIWFSRKSRTVSVLFLLIIPAFFIALFCIKNFTQPGFAPWLDVIGRYLFIIYTGLFIIDQMVDERTVLNLKKSKFLVYTGKISYGLYCFHGIVLTFGAVLLQKLDITLPVIVKALGFLGVNYLVAAASYRYIESPFLKLKDKLRRI
jgi:peptidoglycan/LPS O-acetylase OafA/YrhL